MLTIGFIDNSEQGALNNSMQKTEKSFLKRFEQRENSRTNPVEKETRSTHRMLEQLSSKFDLSSFDSDRNKATIGFNNRASPKAERIGNESNG